MGSVVLSFIGFCRPHGKSSVARVDSTGRGDPVEKRNRGVRKGHRPNEHHYTLITPRPHANSQCPCEKARNTDLLTRSNSGPKAAA